MSGDPNRLSFFFSSTLWPWKVPGENEGHGWVLAEPRPRNQTLPCQWSPQGAAGPVGQIVAGEPETADVFDEHPESSPASLLNCFSRLANSFIPPYHIPSMLRNRLLNTAGEVSLMCAQTVAAYLHPPTEPCNQLPLPGRDKVRVPSRTCSHGAWRVCSRRPRLLWFAHLPPLGQGALLFLSIFSLARLA